MSTENETHAQKLEAHAAYVRQENARKSIDHGPGDDSWPLACLAGAASLRASQVEQELEALKVRLMEMADLAAGQKSYPPSDHTIGAATVGLRDAVTLLNSRLSALRGQQE